MGKRIDLTRGKGFSPSKKKLFDRISELEEENTRLNTNITLLQFQLTRFCSQLNSNKYKKVGIHDRESGANRTEEKK